MSAEEISGRRVGLFAWSENRMIRLIKFRRLLQTRPTNSQIPYLRDVKNLNKENDFEQNVSTMSPPPWRWQPFSLVGSLQQRSAFQSHFARRYRCHCLERRFGAVILSPALPITRSRRHTGDPSGQQADFKSGDGFLLDRNSLEC